jgi:hypothetical protein
MHLAVACTARRDIQLRMCRCCIHAVLEVGARDTRPKVHSQLGGEGYATPKTLMHLHGGVTDFGVPPKTLIC